MSDWRYYVARAKTGEFLDTDAQLSDVELTWELSGPGSATAQIPSGSTGGQAADGRPVYGKWDTILLAEENNELAWGGVCIGANPDGAGGKLDFVSMRGWLEGVPFNDVISRWRTNVFDIARELVAHSRTYPDFIPFTVSQNKSAFTVGDPQPPSEPKQPARKKGESKSAYTASKRYKDWQKAHDSWDEKYGDLVKYEVAWWESPMVGEELDSLAKEANFDYREGCRWKNRSALQPEYTLDLADDLRRRRDDIQFVDGVNLAQALQVKDSDDRFANHLIALGAGEGRAMKRVTVGANSERLYQAEYVQYKSIKDLTRLRALANQDLKVYNNLDPEIDSAIVWDIPGMGDLSSLRCGDEVQVISQNTSPQVDTWRRIVSITRKPVESTVLVKLENAS